MSWRMVHWDYSGERPAGPVDLTACAEGEGVWYPLIPKGLYQDPENQQAFEMTDVWLEPLIENFRRGVAGTQGVPVDEVQQPPPVDSPSVTHRLNEKCFGYITDVDLRNDGLWSYFVPTVEGRRAIKEDGLRYMSPRFVVGEVAGKRLGLKNVIEAAALVSSSLFGNQPGFAVAASMSVGDAEPIALAAPNSEISGGVPMTAEELQAQMDELRTALAGQDEALVNRITQILEARATEITTLQGQVSERDEQITTLQAAQTEQATALETMQTQFTELQGRFEETEREAKLRRQINELENQVLDVDGDKRVRTPEAAAIEAAALVDPTPENSQAFMAHVQANGGRVATMPVGEKPGLLPIMAAAPGPGADLTDEQKLARHTPDTAKRIGKVMREQGVDYETARRQV